MQLREARVTWFGFGFTRIKKWGVPQTITVAPTYEFIPQKMIVPSTMSGALILQIRMAGVDLFKNDAGVPVEFWSEVSTAPQLRFPQVGPTKPIEITVVFFKPPRRKPWKTPPHCWGWRKPLCVTSRDYKGFWYAQQVWRQPRTPRRRSGPPMFTGAMYGTSVPPLELFDYPGDAPQILFPPFAPVSLHPGTFYGLKMAPRDPNGSN